ncbi:MAG: penicillin acylase family protein [Chlamydiota bacterium]
MKEKLRFLIKPKFYLGLFITLIVLIASVVGGGYYIFKASMPKYEGEAHLPALNDDVVIDFDQQGIPTITSDNRLDIARATGYLHAQERFFQMDLLRRSTAGELAELVGPKAIDFDKSRRLHQFRAKAQANYRLLTPFEKELIVAYTEGVNKGLADLSGKPWEYFLLGQKPAEWKTEDSILAGFAMFISLQQDDPTLDLSRGYLKALLPSEVSGFLMDNGSPWDSTLDGTNKAISAIPSINAFDYIFEEQQPIAQNDLPAPELTGSNQWALDGSYTDHQGAIVACDMHLDLNVPNIWYRAAFNYRDGEEEVHFDGITLPGLPVMILGSNGHIAWGFTKGCINTTDVVIIEKTDEKHYLTVEGPKPIQFESEIIKVKGQEPVELEIAKTEWGPIVPNQEYFGKPVALKWIAYEEGAMNLRIVELEKAHNAHEAIDISRNVYIPSLNFMVGDSLGNIAWTVIGYIPKREGYDSDLPVSFADGKARWLGCISPEEYPTIINPKSGILWTANNRTTGNDWLKVLGDGGYFHPARAYQIEQRLAAVDFATPETMLDIQLDEESLYLQRWKDLLLESLEGYYHPGHAEDLELLKTKVVNWDGKASADSEAYYIIRSFREIVMGNVTRRILAPCLKAYDDFNFKYLNFDEPVWNIVNAKTAALHDPTYRSWDQEIDSYLDQLLARLENNKRHIDWGDLSWGNHNRLDMHHPLSKAVPLLKHLTDFSAEPLGGDMHIPKLMREGLGASQRMAVVPGKEAKAIFHMPGGQSGNPLSPYYRRGHQDWLEGNPSPLQPRETASRLTLKPA